MTNGANLMRATGVLHCNLNVRNLATAAAVYERGLGLKVRMRSRGEGQDSTPLGLPGLTDSEAWFLFDHRGGRSAPAVELVEWFSPATANDVYQHPSEVGMQALGFAVPSVADARQHLEHAGAGAGQVVTDADGVTIELIEVASTPAPTFRYVRMVCADLSTTSEWYQSIGFAPGGDVRRLSWPTVDGDVKVKEQILSLEGPPGLELRLNAWPGRDQAKAHESANHRGLFRMAVAVTDVRAAVGAARATGWIDVTDPTYISLPDTPLGGLWVAFFRDPDGVMVEFVERPPAS